MSNLITIASAIWISIAIIIGFITLLAAIMVAAIMITASVEKVVSWVKGENDV